MLPETKPPEGLAGCDNSFKPPTGFFSPQNDIKVATWPLLGWHPFHAFSPQQWSVNIFC